MSCMCPQVGQQQVIAFQNAMAQVQRPCGEGRISKASKKKADSGKRHLLQSSKSNNNNNNIDTSVGPQN